MAAALALAVLAGCDSTQEKNERAKLGATRLLGSREAQRVTERNPDVTVERVALVRGRRKGGAIVVDLRGRGEAPLTDVPITVGIREPGGRRRVLNARKNLDWFQTHVPAIPAGSSVTWVFTTERRLPRRGRPFAIVGVPPSPAISSAESLPALEARTRAVERRRARVRVSNPSEIPQYGLQVYALVRDGDTYVAAGRTSIEHLGTGQAKTATVPLTGPTRGRPVSVHAVPTIFE